MKRRFGHEPAGRGAPVLVEEGPAKKKLRTVDGGTKKKVRKKGQQKIEHFAEDRSESCSAHQHDLEHDHQHSDGEPCCSDCISGPSGDMPACVLEHVLERLEGEDVARCSCVCRGWRETVDIMGENLWRRLYQSRFPDAARAEARHVKGAHCPGLLTNGSIDEAYATRIVAMRNWKAGIYKRDFVPTELTLAHEGVMEGHADICEVCSLCIIGDYCIVGGISGRIKLIDLRDKQTLAWLDGHSDEITDIDVVFLPKRNILLVATTSHDCTARIWEIPVDEIQHSPSSLVISPIQTFLHSRAVFLVHLVDLPGKGFCRVFVTAGSDNDSYRKFEGHTWDIVSGQHCFQHYQSSHFSTAGDILASANGCGLSLFSLCDGRELVRIPVENGKKKRHVGSSKAVALSAPIRRISLNRDASSDNSVMLVDAETEDGMLFLWKIKLSRKSSGEVSLCGMEILYTFQFPDNQRVVLSGFPDPWDGTYLCFATEMVNSSIIEVDNPNVHVQRINVWDISRKEIIGSREVCSNRYYSAFQALRDTRVSSADVNLTSALVDHAGCVGLWTLPSNAIRHLPHQLQDTNLTGTEGSGEGWAAYTSSWRWLVMRDTKGLHVYDFAPTLDDLREEACSAQVQALASARNCKAFEQEVEQLSESIDRTASLLLAEHGRTRLNQQSGTCLAIDRLSAVREVQILRRELAAATERFHASSGVSKMDAFDAAAAEEAKERAESAVWMRWGSSLLRRDSDASTNTFS